MIKEKNKNLEKRWGSLGKRQKIIFVTVFGVVVLLILAIITLYFIYTQDKPKVIPKETRQQIRKVIVKDVAKPIEKMVPSVKIETSSFDYKVENQDFYTANWSSIAKFGFLIKYPKSWTIFENSDQLISFCKEDVKNELVNDKAKYQNTDFPFDSGKTIRLVADNLQSNEDISQYIARFIGTDGVQVVRKKLGENNYYFVTDRGTNRFGGGVGYYYVFQAGSKIYMLQLDYFMNQKEDDYMKKILDLTASEIRK